VRRCIEWPRTDVVYNIGLSLEKLGTVLQPLGVSPTPGSQLELVSSVASVRWKIKEERLPVALALMMRRCRMFFVSAMATLLD